MLLFYRYQVNEDGTLIDNDNGRIMTPMRKEGKKPYHLVKDDNGKFNYFSVDYLMEKLGVEYDDTEVELPEGYTPVEFLEVNQGEKMSQVVFDDIIGDL